MTTLSLLIIKYSKNIELKEVAISVTTSVASYINLLFTRDSENNDITTKLYDKHNAYALPIVNFSAGPDRSLVGPSGRSQRKQPAFENLGKCFLLNVIHFSTVMSNQSSTWKTTTPIKLDIT